MIIDDDFQSAWFETGLNGATGISINAMALQGKDNEENGPQCPY